MRVLSVCSGIGGLDLGIRRAVPSARTVGYVERDAFARRVLRARIADGRLDAAPIHRDLRTLDGRPLRGCVDLVAGGIPCQPFSVAGKQRGLADERWLGDELVRLVDETAAPLVLVENVAGFVRDGLGPLVRGLAARGFRAEWDLFRASDVGAPHRRERLFLLAVADAARPRLEGRGQGLSGLGCGEVADAEHARRGERGTAHDDDGRHASGDDAHGCDPDAWPPGPDDADGWRAWIAAGLPEPAIRRNADGTADRVDRLRCLGNAVVPAVAALAWRTLAGRMVA